MSTATDLRKNLFQELEAAAAGKPVLFTFKGVRMRIEIDASEPKPSKLARLAQRHGVTSASDDDLINWNKDFQKDWEAKWDERFAQDRTED